MSDRKRSTKRAVRVILGAAVLAGLLAGCNAQTQSDGTLGGQASNAGGWVKLPGGRQVMCVAFGSGGISCDWNHAK